MTRKGTVLFLAVIVTFLHFYYAWAGWLFLYEKSGGVTQEGKWTKYGSAPYAWTIPLHLPGTLILREEEKPPKAPGTPPPGFGMLIVLLGSFVTALAIILTAEAWMRRKALVFGRYGWRAAVIFLGLIWIPTPEQLALIYQFTVVF